MDSTNYNTLDVRCVGNKHLVFTRQIDEKEKGHNYNIRHELAFFTTTAANSSDLDTVLTMLH